MGNIARSINDINHRLERLYDAVETGKLDLSDLALRIKELRHRQEQLHSPGGLEPPLKLTPA